MNWNWSAMYIKISKILIMNMKIYLDHKKFAIDLNR